MCCIFFTADQRTGVVVVLGVLYRLIKINGWECHFHKQPVYVFVFILSLVTLSSRFSIVDVFQCCTLNCICMLKDC